MSQELTVITHTYDLIIWSLRHTAKFSRHHRHGLGYRIEDKLHDLQDALIAAKFTSDKLDILREASLRVEQLRLLYREAVELGLLPMKSQRYAIGRLQEIGRQLGGWRRGLTRKTTPR